MLAVNRMTLKKLDFDIWEEEDGVTNMKDLVEGFVFPNVKHISVGISYFVEDLEPLKEFLSSFSIIFPSLQGIVIDPFFYTQDNLANNIQKEFIDWISEFGGLPDIEVDIKDKEE